LAHEDQAGNNTSQDSAASNPGCTSSVKIGLGIDAGGTYTDAVIYDLSGKRLLSKKKALTTKWDFTEGIGEALSGLDQCLLASVNFVALSSTIATNAIVEDKGQNVGLLLMPPYGLFSPEDIPYQPRAIISGQLEITGALIQPVDEEEIGRIANQMVRQHEVKAFAVSGYAGSINPEHELQVKKILKEETGLFVSCGHELSDILDFRTRAHTAVMNARIVPLLARLLSDAEVVLRRFNINAPISVVRGDGSLMRKEAALERPVETVLSGPAASVAGAQHLTGREDALVVDMGGTTTDTAMLRNGRVDTNESGSYVGKHKTHVQALRIRTLGLGGDSLIVWDNDHFLIGPQRVASMAWLGFHSPASNQTLDYIQEHLHIYSGNTSRAQILVRQGHNAELALTAQETDILGLLAERPLVLRELAEKIGMSYWSARIIARLEENHLIQRCGFTPTDVLNCRGDIALWNTETSMRMRDILSTAICQKPSEMIEALVHQVVRRFAQVVFQRQLDEELDSEELESCRICQTLTHKMFGNGNGDYHIRLKMQKPIIGIGAPVHLFLPAAASLLGAEHILPENADVANAVGAITSKVIVRRRVEIRARKNGGFRIEGLAGAVYFSNFNQAYSWAEKELTRIVREIAGNSGTAETTVQIHVEDHAHKAFGSTAINLGCSLLAELKGNPSF
jgi:N-methylhydantoinase A/oxoprolinase/acetone carboxylase beta subunit